MFVILTEPVLFCDINITGICDINRTGVVGPLPVATQSGETGGEFS